MLVIICAASLPIAPCPPDFRPTGWVAPDAESADVNDKTWRQMLSDPRFAIMLSILTCGAFAGLMVISQAAPLTRTMMGLDAATAALVVSVLALFNTAGRILAGWLSDRLGVIASLRLAFLLSGAGMLALLAAQKGSLAAFYGGIALIGLAFGAIMGLYPGFTATQFGSRHNSVNYGIMFVGFALAGFLGPMIMSWVLDATGTYASAFALSATLSIAGLLLSFAFQWLFRKL